MRLTGMRFRGWCAAMCVAAVGLLAGCGDGTDSPTVDPGVQAQLRQDVRSLAEALAAAHLTRARSALIALNADTAAAYAAGKLDRAHLARIRAAAATLSQDLQRLSNTPAPTVTVAPKPAVTVTTTAAAPPVAGGDKGKAADGGKDKGGKAKGGKHG